MPYIPQLRRDELSTIFNKSFDEYIETPGELNYLMTSLALLFEEQHGLSYTTVAEIVHSFECAKLEYYRRRGVPYEDAKIEQNGDVY